MAAQPRRQGPFGYIDDNIDGSRDWGFPLDDIRVPTRIMAAEEDEFMRFCLRWLADHISMAELVWRAGGHVNPKGEEESHLFDWLGHGETPSQTDLQPTDAHLGTTRRA